MQSINILLTRSTVCISQSVCQSVDKVSIKTELCMYRTKYGMTMMPSVVVVGWGRVRNICQIICLWFVVDSYGLQFSCFTLISIVCSCVYVLLRDRLQPPNAVLQIKPIKAFGILEIFTVLVELVDRLNRSHRSVCVVPGNCDAADCLFCSQLSHTHTHTARFSFTISFIQIRNWNQSPKK